MNALLTEADLSAGSVIAIGWGRTVQSIIASGLPSIPCAIVVPTTGGMHESALHFQVNEFVRTVAEQMWSDAHFLHVPSLASAELRLVLSRDPETARIRNFWSRADAAVLGIGDFQRATTNRNIAFESHEHIVGDVWWHCFDEDGQEIRWPGQDNLMAIGREQLRRIPLSIGVAIGREKVRAIIGAARSGMVNALVTETRVARLMLEHLESTSEPFVGGRARAD